MGNWYKDERIDYYNIEADKVKRNAHSVVAICRGKDLFHTGDGYIELKIKNYGEIYHLCPNERFHNQSASQGFMCTGVLVGEDIVATAAHITNEANLKNLHFIFGYVMKNPITANIKIPIENVYQGIEILFRKYDIDEPYATGTDWVLIRLDRKVINRKFPILSKRPVFPGQSIYVLGHPCGLPLKYAPGIAKYIEKAYFTAEIGLYSGNSGSPCFCAETHEMVGIISASDPVDFKQVGDCYVSVIYPDNEIVSHGSRCIKVFEFNEYLTTDINGKNEFHIAQLQPFEVNISAQNKKFLEDLLLIIKKKFSDPDFDIDALCKQLLSSRSTLCKKIKSMTGETPNQFIQSYRLSRARQLIEENFGNIIEVAEAVGFLDPSYFSKCFKDKFGISPKLYQIEFQKKFADKIKRKKLNESTNKGNQKKISIQVDFTLDELDREYISWVVATKSEPIFSFKDTEGTPQRSEIFKKVEMLYNPPIPLASMEDLKNFTLREIMQKMRKKIKKMNYKR